MFARYLVAFCSFLPGPALAYWRMSCMGVVATGRIDPIVAPNETSSHEHTLKGSSGVSPFATTDDLLNADCSSCEIAQDKSAYWSPQMYFFDSDNNTYVEVPEVQGHITYYKNVPAFISNGSYVQPTAIPNGMKMLSGNTYRRNFTLPVPDPPLPWTSDDATQEALQQKAIGFNCLNYEKTPEGTLQRHFLPDKNFLETECPDGIRLEVLFPICWNGQDLTSSSSNFTSHVAYSDAGANGGNCPQGYDVVINQLLFETIYPTQNFVGKNGFYTLANGDPTGYGYHGDAFIAWEGDTQQEATEQCGSSTSGPGANGIPSQCPVFDIQSTEAQSSCKLTSQGIGDINVNIDASGPLGALPGNNPIQSGPQDATPAPSAGSGGSGGSGALPAAPSGPMQDDSTPSTTLSTLVAAPSSMSSFTSIPTPVITPVPSPAAPPAQVVEWATTTYTTGGVEDILVEEVIVETTTLFIDRREASPTPSPALKRRTHLHRHQRRAGRL